MKNLDEFQLSNMLEYENAKQAQANGESLKALAQESREENAAMKSLTEKSTKDAAAVKVITLITIVYLPTTVVAVGLISIVIFHITDNCRASFRRNLCPKSNWEMELPNSKWQEIGGFMPRCLYL